MKVIVSGGGTGGHIYPALAIARGIMDRIPSADILYVGSQRGMEHKIVPAEGWNYKSIDITGIDRSSMLKASQSLAKFPRSFFQSWNIIKKFKPDVVVGTGGYASFPLVMAATFFPCRTYIHEQNAVPGLANRNLAKRVNCVMLNFAEAEQHLDFKRVKVTGLPVRQEIFHVHSQKARERLGFDEDKFTIVAFGGSQGAASINQAMIEVVQRYCNRDVQIIWITGNNNYEKISEQVKQCLSKTRQYCRLHLLPYMNNIQDALAIANLGICRAGAGTLSELAILGLPAILVPYPYAAENHQEKNARALCEKKAAEMVIDEFLDGDTLYKRVESLRLNPQKLAEMSINLKKEARPRALEDILNTILEEC